LSAPSNTLDTSGAARNALKKKHEAVVDYCERENIVFVPYFPLRGVGGRTLEEIAARWLLRRSPVMLPIPGTLSLEHLKENLAGLEIELTDEEFEALSARRGSGD
jgi:aryl-alcohol dehydrogenase-like predicted oxidoreductase